MIKNLWDIHIVGVNCTTATDHFCTDKLTYKSTLSTQQRIMDAGVWHLLVHVIYIYYHKQTVSLYDLFWSVSSTHQIGYKIKFN